MVVLVDEFAALLALVDRAPGALANDTVALTYSRAYRLTRALLDPGPGRLRVRGRFTRLADELTEQERHILHARLADPNEESDHVVIIDPRPTIRATAAIQNTYALSLLQAETLAAGAANDWPVRFLDADSATETMQRAAQQTGPRPGSDRPVTRNRGGHRVVTDDRGPGRTSPDEVSGPET